jgi:hypothetical protein
VVRKRAKTDAKERNKFGFIAANANFGICAIMSFWFGSTKMKKIPDADKQTGIFFGDVDLWIVFHIPRY